MLKLIRTFAATLLLLPALAVDAPAQTVPTASENPPATSTHLAVERGLQFLQKEAYRWKAAKGCAACHHAPLAVWAFNEARAKGYAVDKAALNELTTWEFSATRTNAMSVQPPPRDVLNLGAVYVLLSVEPAPPPVKPAGDSPAIQDQQTPAQNGPPPNPATDPNADPNLADRQFLLQHVVAKQVADGSWGLPMDLRVPLGGPVEDIAILSRIALLQSGDDSTSVTACLARAAEWLAANHDDQSRQARNLRLLMNTREGKPAAELDPIIAAIKAEQNPDGGWSQTPQMASDAYATGQSLYILARAGVRPEEEAMARGVEFLTRTQQDEGSWPMTSRVNSKDMTPITATGAAWAVLGILRASP